MIHSGGYMPHEGQSNDLGMGYSRLATYNQIPALRDGRLFRYDYEIILSTTGNIVLRFTFTTDVIIHTLSTGVDTGFLRNRMYTMNGISGGVFVPTTRLIVPANTCVQGPMNRTGLTVPPGTTIFESTTPPVIAAGTKSIWENRQNISGIVRDTFGPRWLSAGNYNLQFTTANSSITGGMLYMVWEESPT